MTAAPLSWEGARLEGAWQGIEHLSLVINAPGTVPRAVLTAHLNQPADGLEPRDVRVTGPRPLPHAVVFPVDGGGNRVDRIEIQLPELGDRSTYYLQLDAGGAHPLHPFFAFAPFVFTVDCDTGDCRPPTGEADRPLALPPALDLLTKDYTGFVQMLGERVLVTNPAWADLTPASFERVLLELLAHQGDLLSYYQDRVANEAFLDTASQRFSLRQHGMLLGYRLFEGSAARTLLAFEGVTNPGFVPAGLEVIAPRRAGEVDVVFTTSARTPVHPANDTALLFPAAWPGATDARLSAGSTELLLFGHATALRVGMRLAILAGSFTQIVTLTEVTLLAQPGWTASPLDPPHTNVVPVSRIAWDARERLGAELAPWSPAGDRLISLHANLVDARHGAPRRAELSAAPPAGAGTIAVRITRQNSVVTRVVRDGTPTFHLRALKVPEGPVSFVSADGGGAARPALEVAVGGDRWEAQEHLHRSRSYHTHYVASADNDGGVWIQFGDGVHGREVRVNVHPATGEATIPVDGVVLTYRVGDPILGNCARGVLSQIVPPEPPTSEAARDLATLGAPRVTNVLPGQGGRAPETLDAARQSIPRSLRHGPLERAVTLDDYARAAEEVEGVARAAARALGGPFNTVLVLVDPRGQGDLDPRLLAAVDARLDFLRMTGREVRVQPPEYVPMEVELGLCVEPGWARHEVRERVYAALRPGTDRRPGFFHPDELDFGEDIERGDVLARVQAVPGVRSVKALRFRRLRDPSAIDAYARVAMDATEVARLDGDDTHPENGRLVVKVVGIDPDLDDADYEIDTSPGLAAIEGGAP